MRLPLLLLAATLLLATACSGSDEPTAAAGSTPRATATPTANPDAENDLAKTYLLTINDFPTGWAENPPDDDEAESPTDKCDDFSELRGRSGRAFTGDFSRGGVAEVSQGAALFPDDATAAAAMQQVSGRLDCLAKIINDGGLDEDDAEFSGAKVGTISFPSHGDETMARRLTFEVAGDGMKADLFADLVIVRKGRILTAVYAVDALSPFSTNELVPLVEKAVAKLP